MRVAIFGIGALGCVFGAYLNQVCDVQLVGQWPEQRKWLEIEPLRLINLDGSITNTKLAINTQPDSGSDYALVLTKSRDLSYVAQMVKQALKSDGIAITLQNGIGNVDILTQVVPQPVIAGVTMMGATVEGVGTVRIGGYGTTHLGTTPDLEPQIRVLANLLAQSGLPTALEANIDALLWGKLAINAAINPLTALLRVTNGALLESAWARQIMLGAASEVASVARAKGIILPFDNVGLACEQVAQATALNRSSMLQDVLRGAKTENEVISGAVVREARLLDIPVPFNLMLYQLVRALEDSAEKRIG